MREFAPEALEAFAVASFPVWKKWLPEASLKPGNPWANQHLEEAIRLKTGRAGSEDIETGLGKIGLDAASVAERINNFEL